MKSHDERVRDAERRCRAGDDAACVELAVLREQRDGAAEAFGEWIQAFNAADADLTDAVADRVRQALWVREHETTAVTQVAYGRVARPMFMIGGDRYHQYILVVLDGASSTVGLGIALSRSMSVNDVGPWVVWNVADDESPIFKRSILDWAAGRGTKRELRPWVIASAVETFPTEVLERWLVLRNARAGA